MPIIQNRPDPKAPRVPEGVTLQITEISASAGVTINLGNYSSARYDSSAHAAIRTDSDAPPDAGLLEACRRVLYGQVQAHVDRVAQFIVEHKRLPNPQEL